MTDIAIRVENLSKLYPELSARAGHIGALQQRHDTTSTLLSAGLRDALTGFLPRISRISRKEKGNSSNSSNSWQASGSPDDDTNLWALKEISFEARPPWTQPSAGLRERSRRVKRGEVVSTTCTAWLGQ